MNLFSDAKLSAPSVRDAPNIVNVPLQAFTYLEITATVSSVNRPRLEQVPPMPANGWTVKSLRAALLYFPENTPIKIFCPFDAEGPESWENLQIKHENGLLKLTP